MSDLIHDDHDENAASAVPDKNSPASINPAHLPPRPIRCDCGRALTVKVDRERAILRCPVHGIQFRYTVTRDK